MKNFNKSKLAAAVGTATLALAMSNPASAVVVVGGDNGWEISFDGNVNAFYTFGDYEDGFSGLGLEGGATPGADLDASRVTSGFLPAFFSFNVTSPTVNGLTGSARFSFAPAIQNSNIKNQTFGTGLPGGGTQGIQGSSIDTREVLFNLDGSFGRISAGRTLSIFGRNAILNDMTLFGVGVPNGQNGSVTAGRIGRGYTYPNFNARFSYQTPDINGFQAEIGIYDPSVEQVTNALGAPPAVGAGALDETETPRFEGELNYATSFQGGDFKVWGDFLWQEIGNTAGGFSSQDVYGIGGGANINFGGFGLTGYYYDGEGLGRSLQFLGGTTINDSGNTTAADNDGYYVQGTYTFMGKTKVGISYGESNQDAFNDVAGSTDVSLEMLTVGVYHDVTSWFKLIAEYSDLENDFGPNGKTKADVFSVGTFFTW